MHLILGQCVVQSYWTRDADLCHNRRKKGSPEASCQTLALRHHPSQVLSLPTMPVLHHPPSRAPPVLTMPTIPPSIPPTFFPSSATSPPSRLSAYPIVRLSLHPSPLLPLPAHLNFENLIGIALWCTILYLLHLLLLAQHVPVSFSTLQQSLNVMNLIFPPSILAGGWASRWLPLHRQLSI